jgi:hypothetical protein
MIRLQEIMTQIVTMKHVVNKLTPAFIALKRIDLENCFCKT